MTVSSAAPPLFMQLLADRNGSPAGLLFDAAPAVAPSDLPHEALGELAAHGACYFRADLAAELADALRAQGWQPLAAEQLLRADAAFPFALAPSVQCVEGDWFLEPPPQPVGQQAMSRALALQLVQLVSADADTHEIESVLRRDPTLSYQLLRLVNSLGVGSGRRVTSFSQAILILGRAQLRRWLNLMLFCTRDGDLRSPMLLGRVAVRARAMELLAQATGMDKARQEQAFMAGMFSLLGVLFGLPLAEVLQPLTIADAVQQALLRHEGAMGDLLLLLERAERRDFAAVAAQLAQLQLSGAEFNQIVADAHLWMQSVAASAADMGHA
ncbi:HDOD domain-containing protein [Duganella sp. LX20W]|uniref:HDOD domain-containing protein n=1 Tax=Rugamonas brunnea TaxID=2758569 RepID=A0A7W2ICB9_9BURK|nr:HDOD domain-containing protein [Rugamonas brunnea]MBA5637812.1 HDOD domain-containing protein [Rugamonas brunnea]